jgi:GT2 family glycosyltransferase
MASVSVVVLAYGPEPWLADCIRSALASEGVHVDVVLVDNGAPEDVVAELATLPGVTLVSPGRNTGFAGGCNLGASHASGEVLVLLNDDALVEPLTLARLVASLDDAAVGLSCASVRLAEDRSLLNTDGNPLHFTGLSWAGGHLEPAREGGGVREVPIAAGTCLAVRRRTWELLGGLDEDYFAYHEDVDLSWRCWQRGLRCINVPDAVAVHRYEFSRNPTKMYLLERNRLFFLLTVHQRRTLLLLAPALLLVEVAMLGLAAREGWLRQKAAGYRWLLANRRRILLRRRRVQEARVRPDADLVELLTGRLNPTNVPLSGAMRALDALLRVYWRVMRRRIELSAGSQPRR